MKAEELQGKTVDELNTILEDNKKKLFNYRFQAKNGELTDTSVFKKLRREVARIKTILTQRINEAGEK